MKKTSLLLALASAFLLVGCNSAEKDKGSSSESSSQPSSSGGSQCTQSSVTVTDDDFGNEESPLSVAEAIELLETVDECKTGSVYTAHKFYVYGLCVGNTEASTYNDYKFVNLVDYFDESKKLTVMYATLDSGITGDYTAEDCFKDAILGVSGYGMWYKKNGQYTAELTKNGNSDKPVIFGIEGGSGEVDEGALDVFAGILSNMYEEEISVEEAQAEIADSSFGLVSDEYAYSDTPSGSTDAEKAEAIAKWFGSTFLPTGYSVEYDGGYAQWYSLQDDDTYYYCIDYVSSAEDYYVSVMSYFYEADPEDSEDQDAWCFWFEVYTAAQYAEIYGE